MDAGSSDTRDDVQVALESDLHAAQECLNLAYEVKKETQEKIERLTTRVRELKEQLSAHARTRGAL